MTTTKKSKRQSLDSRRIGQLAFDFFKANQTTLFSPQVSMAMLNQDHEQAATAILRRLAHEPGLQLDGTPTGVLALMCGRIARHIMEVRDHSDRSPDVGMLIDDSEARAIAFEHPLGALSLSSTQHGKLLIDGSSGLVH